MVTALYHSGNMLVYAMQYERQLTIERERKRQEAAAANAGKEHH